MAGKKRKQTVSPNYCEIPDCGWSIIVQRHRIKPGRDGGKYEMGNVISLCPNHHALADRGLDEPRDPRWLNKTKLRAIIAPRIKQWKLEQKQNESTESGTEASEGAGDRSTEEPAPGDANGAGDASGSTPDAG